MYSENKDTRDSGSVGEELLAGSSDLEERGRAVFKAVREGYFDIERALRAIKYQRSNTYPINSLRN